MNRFCLICMVGYNDIWSSWTHSNEQYSFPTKMTWLLNFTMSLKFKERTFNGFEASLKGKKQIIVSVLQAMTCCWRLSSAWFCRWELQHSLCLNSLFQILWTGPLKGFCQAGNTTCCSKAFRVLYFAPLLVYFGWKYWTIRQICCIVPSMSY